jgi:programmed cell death 6-interacting protein
VKVAFVWFDSLRKNKKLEELDPNLEKAALLFNIGALHSLEALKEKRTGGADGDGLKRAVQLFGQAAGIFAHISETPELARPSVTANMDLSADGLSLMSALMLAQSQACFFEKAAGAASTPALVAKLAAGAAKLFRSAQAVADRGELKSWLSHSPYPWARHAQYQAVRTATHALGLLLARHRLNLPASLLVFTDVLSECGPFLARKVRVGDRRVRR